MKWKKGLTPEEAALISTGLQRFKTFEEVKTWVSGQKSIIGDQGMFRNTDGFLESTWLQMELDSAEDAFYEAEEIKEGLNLEIRSAWTYMLYGTMGSSLFIHSVEWSDEQSDAEALETCTVLKESLAWWFYEMGDIDKAKIFDQNFDPHNFSNTKSLKNPTNEFSYDNYPVKLQLAISAYKYFWEEENAGDQRANSDVETWLHEEAIRLEIKHVDDGKPMPSISNKVKEVITQIIKPD